MSRDPSDFGADAFAARISPFFVDESARPGARTWGDAMLDPSLAGRIAGSALREAAVLVPIVTHPGEAGVILTVRTEHLSSHAGQVAFPGGKIDREDAGPVAAALREAEEEIGLDRADVVALGRLPAYASASGYSIVPVIGLVRPGAALTLNPHEVADVFEVPLGFLMTAANHRVGHRVWQGRRRYFYEMPFGDRYIWGVTAGIVRQIFEQTYGRGAPPAPGTPAPDSVLSDRTSEETS